MGTEEKIEQAKQVRKGIMAWAAGVGTNWLVAAAMVGWLVAVVCAAGWWAK